jgi:uncharacterized protein (TIGR02996 family)
MNEEAGFLDALGRSPDDEATRAAYSDWLEERGDPRAELFEVERRLRDAPDDLPLRERLAGLHASLNAAWVARVARPFAPLAELRVAVPPPLAPVRPRGRWAAVEKSLGLWLPADYKAFLDVYGVGMINHLIEIDHPFTCKGDLREGWLNGRLSYQTRREIAEVPYPIFPDAGGLLPFGSLGDFDVLGWLTAGLPHEWPFVYYSEEGCVQREGLSAVGFLLEAVTGRSALLNQFGLNELFKPFLYFEPSWPGRDVRRLEHPERLDLKALAARLVARWPAADVRVFHADLAVYILADPYHLAFDLAVTADGTQLTNRYGTRGKTAARAIWTEMKAEGFRVLW